jgi:glycosyltransferase involved in cell wall biosynthesis
VLLYRRHAESISAQQKPSILVPGHQQSWLGLLEASLQRRRQRGQRVLAETPSSARITVVLVVRNGRKFLPSALATVRRQSLRPIEILAIVGPSNDGTEDYLAEQPDVRVAQQSGSGLAAARNQAVKTARGDWIAFLDCDDLWHPAKLSSQVEVLSLLDRPGFSVTSFVRVESVADDLAKVKRIAGDDVRIGMTPSALMVHRKVFDAVGEFDPAMGVGSDTDWFSRVMELEVPCAVASQILLYKRIHDTNLSHDALRNRREMFRVIQKNRILKRSAAPSE